MGLGDKNRVVAEPASPLLFKSDGSAAGSPECPDQLAARGRRHDADEPGLPAGGRHASHRPQQLSDIRLIVLPLPCKAGRANPGAPSERLHLQPGILGENQQRGVPRCLHRFLNGVGRESGAVLPDRRDLRKTIERDPADRQTFQKTAQFPDLVAVTSGEKKGQRIPLRATR